MESRLCAIGHSLGSAVAIDFARRHRIQRVVAIAPFTTLREEAARVITGPLSYLLIENYDNRAGIVDLRQRNPEAKMAIFHGTKDEVIPVRMGRELAQNFPFIDFFPIEGANHVSVLSEARQNHSLDEQLKLPPHRAFDRFATPAPPSRNFKASRDVIFGII